MFALSFVISLALVPFVAAQAAQTNSLNITAIEAHFTQSEIVPDLLSSFDPSALLTLNFTGDSEVQPGQLLTVQQVAPTPTVTVTAANSSVSLNGIYTLVMVDADVVGSKLPEGQTRHWLVNGVTISGSIVTNSSAVGITTYAGPFPAAGSGPHRYVVLLYAQPSTFTPPTALSKPNMGVSTFNFTGYVKDSGLGPLVAATYFTVEEGTTTASIPPTSAVVTSTLLPSSSIQSSAGSSAPSGTSGAVRITSHLTTLISAAVAFVLVVAFL